MPRLADKWSQPWRALSGTTHGQLAVPLIPLLYLPPSSRPLQHLPHLQLCLFCVFFSVVHCSLVHFTFNFWCTILGPAIFMFKKGANFSSAAGLCFLPPFLNSHVLRTLTAHAEQAPASHSCSHSRPCHQCFQSPTLGSARSLSLRPRSPRHRHFAAYATCCFLIINLSTIIYIFINCVFCFVLHNRYGPLVQLSSFSPADPHRRGRTTNSRSNPPSRDGSSTLVLVLKSALSTFFEVLDGAFKHLTKLSTCACT